MPTPVTDPDLLAQLNAPDRAPVAAGPKVWGDAEAEQAGLYESRSAAPKMRPVTDPALLAQLNGEQFDARFSGESTQGPQNAEALQAGLEARAAGPGVLAKAIEPITSYPSTYADMNRDARGQMSQGVQQVREAITQDPAGGEGQVKFVKGLGNAALGGVSYLASPINAALRTVVGKPVEDVTGIPKEYPEMAASFAIPGIGPARLQAGARPVAANSAQQVAAASARLGVPVPRAVASDNMLTQQAGQVVSNVPVVGLPVVRGAERTVEGLGRKADEVAQGFAPSASVVGGGDAARVGIKDWIGPESKAKVTKAYDAVDALVNPQIATPLASTQQMVSSIAAERSAAALPGGGKAVEMVLDGIQRPGGLNYAGIKTLRTRIGEMLDSGVLPADTSGKELKRIYGALTEDLGNAAQNAGGAQARAAWERANRYNSLISDRREQLAKIVGMDGNAPAERVFDTLVAKAGSKARADVEALAKARKVIGADGWDDFAGGVVSRMGRDVEGNFSPRRFLTAYEGLSDAGKSIMFRSTDKGNLAQHLDDIATISSRFKQLEKFANPSGTARSVLGGGMGAALFTEPLTTISTVIGSYGLARALASPVTAAPVAQLARAQLKLVMSPTPKSVAAFGIASRNLTNTLNDIGVAANSNDFLKAIQGPMRGAAENEQP